TVFVVDVSESMPDAALEQARDRVQDAWSVRGRHEVRLVRFGSRAEEVVLPTDPQVPLSPIARMDEDAGRATDLEGALRLAFALLPHERLKRVVVVSDGLETRGSCGAARDTALRFGVQVHHLDLSALPRPAELMVTGLTAPPDIKARVPFEVTATVKATEAMSARCELTIDGVLAETADATLEPGDNPVLVGARVREGGDRRLAISCTAPDEGLDRIATNNRFEVPVRIPDKPKVLYVEGERRYRRNLLAALEKDFEVELRGPSGVPATLGDAQRFDAIIVSDVPRAGSFGRANVARRHMRALQRYVRGGGGLIWTGGENSFGPGGYGGTLLERKVMPVRFDVARKDDIPSLALVLVIDRSGSMSGPKIELAKEAARATLDVLQPSDKLGIIAFDSAPVTVVRLQRAANRLKITDSVSRLSPGGGTAIFPALDQAYRALSATQAKVKHIILLTDGQSNRSGVLDLVAQAYSERITISTVAVGMGSDQRLLMQVAEEGGGRYYFTDRADNIPKLFLKEASQVSRRALVEDRFRPRMVKRYRHHQIFKGLDFRKAPPLLGYVSTRPKSRAEVMLRTHLGEPLLARWRLGLGRAVVWTSDIKNKWSHAWLRWPGYAKFWRQLVRDSLRVERQEPTFQMTADIAQGVMTIGVDAVDDADQFLDGLVSEVTITDPHGADHPLSLDQTAPGHYGGTMRLEAFGPYTIRGRHSPADDPDALHRSYQAIAWPFPTEHLLGEPNLAAIRDLSATTGGVEGPTNAQLLDTEGRTTPIRTPRWPLPLYLALALLLLDVMLRRIRLYGTVIDQL
ncbi:MAG: VWA domain-containing protein, partial [Myxococcota bacterium]|nr:VWA domain-containing protein [Myxococcota bacterium]